MAKTGESYQAAYQALKVTNETVVSDKRRTLKDLREEIADRNQHGFARLVDEGGAGGRSAKWETPRQRAERTALCKKCLDRGFIVVDDGEDYCICDAGLARMKRESQHAYLKRKLDRS